MISPGDEERATKAAEYLHLLRSLSTEVERAMQAIAKNAVSELEDSIANQQRVSDRLGKLAEELWVPLNATVQLAYPRADEEMIRKISNAAGDLGRLNRQYATLLQYSRRSVALMASVFGSFQGQFQEASGSRSKHRTWSCQM
jgi:hypothetical protein